MAQHCAEIAGDGVDSHARQIDKLGMKMVVDTVVSEHAENTGELAGLEDAIETRPVGQRVKAKQRQIFKCVSFVLTKASFIACATGSTGQQRLQRVTRLQEIINYRGLAVLDARREGVDGGAGLIRRGCSFFASGWLVLTTVGRISKVQAMINIAQKAESVLQLLVMETGAEMRASQGLGSGRHGSLVVALWCVGNRLGSSRLACLPVVLVVLGADLGHMLVSTRASRLLLLKTVLNLISGDLITAPSIPCALLLLTIVHSGRIFLNIGLSITVPSLALSS